jgi:hypothetical protein
MTVRTALVALSALACACTPSRIPGTEIDATPDSTAVYDVALRYRAALEKRDAAGVMALVAPGYYDTAGTPDPSDDLDHARLKASLEQELQKTDDLKVDFTVRRIEVKGDDAQVEIFFDAFYRVKTPVVSVPRRDSDVQRLRLKRIQGQWLLTGGL